MALRIGLDYDYDWLHSLANWDIAPEEQNKVDGDLSGKLELDF